MDGHRIGVWVAHLSQWLPRRIYGSKITKGSRGIHTQNPDLSDWNTALVESYLTQSPSILIHWAKRERGLVTREKSDISHIEDVIGKRLVARQPGAGAQELSRNDDDGGDCD